MAQVNLLLHGSKALKAQLRTLRKEFGQPALRRAARAGGAVLRTGTRAQVRPSLRKDVVSQESRGASPAEALVKIGFRRGKGARGFVLRFRETGTRPHRIPKAGKTLRSGKKVLAIHFGSLIVFRKFVNHPGQRARPFLRQVFAAKKEEAIQAVSRVYNEAIQKAGKKIA